MTDNPDGFPCPSCGFYVFSEEPGSYCICSICNWEDDHVQLKYPFMGGGANKGSLWEYQQRILKTIPEQVRSHEGIKRANEWRPLTESDRALFDQPPKTGMEYFQEAARDAPLYYWQIR